MKGAAMRILQVLMVILLSAAAAYAQLSFPFAAPIPLLKITLGSVHPPAWVEDIQQRALCEIEPYDRATQRLCLESVLWLSELSAAYSEPSAAYRMARIDRALKSLQKIDSQISAVMLQTGFNSLQFNRDSVEEKRYSMMFIRMKCMHETVRFWLDSIKDWRR